MKKILHLFLKNTFAARNACLAVFVVLMFTAGLNRHYLEKLCKCPAGLKLGGNFKLPPNLAILKSRPSNTKDFQKVRLNWLTASELNNEGFHVERSTDGLRWQTLGFVAGNGTTSETHEYSFLDEKPLLAIPLQGGRGMNYYRLRQTDFDGGFENSQVVSVEVGRDVSSFRIFPNPATGTVTLALETSYIGEATLTLFDLTGNQMERTILTLEGNVQQHNLDLSNVPSGIYFVKLATSSERWRQRLVVK